MKKTSFVSSKTSESSRMQPISEPEAWSLRWSCELEKGGSRQGPNLNLFLSFNVWWIDHFKCALVTFIWGGTKNQSFLHPSTIPHVLSPLPIYPDVGSGYHLTQHPYWQYRGEIWVHGGGLAHSQISVLWTFFSNSLLARGLMEEFCGTSFFHAWVNSEAASFCVWSQEDRVQNSSFTYTWDFQFPIAPKC